MATSCRGGEFMIVDGVSGVGGGRTDREIAFRLVECVNAIERLALLDVVADLLEQPDAGTLVERSASGTCQPVQPQAIDRGDHALMRGLHVKTEMSELGAAIRRALGVDDLLHLLQGHATLEQLASARISGAAAQLRIIFQEMGGKTQRFLAQIARVRPARWRAPPSRHWPRAPGQFRCRSAGGHRS